MLYPAYSAPVTGGLAHMAIPACSAGHTFVRFLFRAKVTFADFIVFCPDAFVRDHLFYLGPAGSMHNLVMDSLGCDPALADGMCNKAKACCIADRKDLHVRSLADIVYQQSIRALYEWKEAGSRESAHRRRT